jgi:hypothetical protein
LCLGRLAKAASHGEVEIGVTLSGSPPG